MKIPSQNWIHVAYEQFSEKGFDALKIEPLAQQLGVSKSSFYHHFGDMDLFLDEVLLHHLHQCRIIHQKEQKAQTINPQLIEILIDHSTDILFHRQLRFHQNHPKLKDTFEKSNQIIGKEFVRIFMNEEQITLNTQQTESLYKLALENFFIQLDKSKLNEKWLMDYFNELKRTALHFQK